MYKFKALAILSLIAIAAALMPRQQAPAFTAQAVMPDLTFKTVNLSDYIGKYVILLFYPFDFTYVCPTQIIAYAKSAAQFRENNAEILAISVDSHFSHLAWRKTTRQNGGLGTIDIPLVADITKSISKAYEVLVQDQTDGLYGVTVRGLFVIDTKGKIRSITINDEQVGRNPVQTLRIVKAFQHADEHGVVCPASWQPGSKTIVPDQQKMKQYFQGL